MAKTPRKQQAAEASPTKREKPFECQLAGRFGLGVAVVRQVLSVATPENLKALRDAFEAGSDLLGELFQGLFKPQKKPTPEADKE